MGCKSPSKFTSLEKLLAIRDNNYRSVVAVSGGVVYDYEASEVDELIWLKQGELADNKYEQIIEECE